MSLNLAANLVRGQYAPRGNVHHPELDAKYLSVSNLVGKTAREYADKILNRPVDEVDRFWAFKGNSASNAALADFTHKEIAFRYELGETGWAITGHCDAIYESDGKVVVLEHKAHARPTAMKKELAFRQGALYLALGWHTVHGGSLNPADTVFESAAYVGEDYPAFTWPATARPAGVVVCIAPERPPAIVEERPMGPGECAEMLQFYSTKAWYVLNAVQNNNLALADEWDLGPVGLQEFKLTLDEMESAAGEELEALVKRREELRDQAEVLNDEVSQLTAKIQAAMVLAQKKRLQVGNYSVTIVEMPAVHKDYWQKPGIQLRIKEL